MIFNQQGEEDKKDTYVVHSEAAAVVPVAVDKQVVVAAAAARTEPFVVEAFELASRNSVAGSVEGSIRRLDLQVTSG